MTYDFERLFGPLLSEQALVLAKTQAIARYASWAEAHYVHFVQCRRREGGNETIILEIEVELAQRTLYPIEPVERIAITVAPADTDFPEVVSLRENFPEVPHLNLREIGSPKSFCLYAEPYAELKLHWTAHLFVERIREWLARTAEGNLHPDDQPLEPLLSLGFGTLAIPEDFDFGQSNSLEPYYVYAIDPAAPRSVWTIFRPMATEKARPPTHVALAFNCPPQTHGVLTVQPTDLAELERFLARSDFDLVRNVRAQLTAWESGTPFALLAGSRPFLIFNLPKRRTSNGPTQSSEQVAFLCDCNLKELKQRLETFQVTQQHTGLIQIPETVREGANIPLLAFDVTRQFSPKLAALLNGTAEETRGFCLLGAGALGSQVFDHLLRSGFGKWTVVDHDRLLPHNLARHRLGGRFVGAMKAEAVCQTAQELALRELAQPITADLLAPKEEEVGLKQAMADAAAVLDCTASVPVSRALANGELGSKRVVSLFLNPRADALVLLAEDEKRACRLDWLEMQYYRAIVRDPALATHLKTASKTRYSNACRSLTSQVSHEAVALFSAIGSRVFRESANAVGAAISIWKLDQKMEVTRIDLPPEPVITRTVGGWVICTDHELLRAVSHFRLLRLPKETGGVLLGSYDMQRRIIYVVEMLPSPSDSEEWPTSYKRGCRGLARTIDKVRERTLLNLEYVGEWHSHPDGCGVGQSDKDRCALGEISIEMAKTGLPGLMLIVGTTGAHAFYLEESR